MPKCGFCSSFVGAASEVLSHQRAGCRTDPRWGRVEDLIKEGKRGKAARVARRILGVKRKTAPMTTETKEYLRQRRAERKAAGVVSVSDIRR